MIKKLITPLLFVLSLPALASHEVGGLMGSNLSGVKALIPVKARPTAFS